MGENLEGSTAAPGPSVAGERRLLIASNRGPVRFEVDDAGKLIASRGAGGLVTALSHAMSGSGGVWVASAMAPGDREAVKRSGGGHIDYDDPAGGALRLRYLTFAHEVFDRYYHRISNWMLWFMQHALWNLPMNPRFDHTSQEAWRCYHEVNERFAVALSEEVAAAAPGSPVMLHDYHLMLAGMYLRKLEPEAFLYHFTHSPWATPDLMRVLPGTMAPELLEGMLSHDLLGFHAPRWSRNFMWCCADILGAEADLENGVVRYGGREVVVRNYPISVDAGAVREVAASDQGASYVKWVKRSLESRRLILRIDRMEPSKNILRGLLAFENMLQRNPAWRERVVHMALLYPSRRALREYRDYEAEVFATADRINLELGTHDWQPVLVLNEDNYPRAIAALTLYDVLIVNPIMDGMNLVAKEGPAVNENGGALVLSKNAGAWQELAGHAIGVNPYDVGETADAMLRGLEMPEAERRERARGLRAVVEASTPELWVQNQLNDIEELSGRRL